MSYHRSILGALMAAFVAPSLCAQQPPRVDAFGDPLPPGAILRLGTHRLAAGGSQHLALTPDGKFLATASVQTVQFWNPDTGKLLRSWSTPERGERVTDYLVISPNGQWLASGNYGSPLRLRDAHSGKIKWTLSKEDLYRFAFFPDGQTLLCGSYPERGLHLHDVATGKRIRSLDTGHLVSCFAFSADGRYFAAGGRNQLGHACRVVGVWERSTHKRICQVEQEDDNQHEQGIAFLPDNCHFLVSTTKLALYEVTTGKLVRVVRKEGLGILATDRQNKRMICSKGETWDLEKLEVLHRLPDVSGDGAAAMSADGTRAATMSPLRVWDVKTGKPTFAPPGHGYATGHVAFTPNDQEIVTYSELEGAIRFWDVKTAQPVETFRTERAPYPRLDHRGLRFFGDGSGLIVGCERWDLARKIRLPAVRDFPPDCNSAESHFLMAPDGKLAVDWGPQGGARFWDVAKGRVIRTLALPHQQEGPWIRYAFSPDGKTLAIGYSVPPFPEMPSLWLVEAASGKILQRLRPHASWVGRAEFSQDGQWLILSTRREAYALEIWHVPSRQLCRGIVDRSLEQHHPPFALAPHGQVLASCDPETGIVLFETATGQRIARLPPGHRSFICALAFSHDAMRLVSCSQDYTSLVWSLASQATARLDKDDDRLHGALAAEAAHAYPILWALTQSPKRAVALARSRLETDPAIEPKELNRLIAELGSVVFHRRSSAMERLRQMGLVALPALQAGREQARDAETRRRLDELVHSIPTRTPAPDLLRDMRLIQMLEIIGTGEARQVLQRVEQTSQHGPRAVAARAALERLARRNAP